MEWRIKEMLNNNKCFKDELNHMRVYIDGKEIVNGVNWVWYIDTKSIFYSKGLKCQMDVFVHEILKVEYIANKGLLCEVMANEYSPARFKDVVAELFNKPVSEFSYMDNDSIFFTDECYVIKQK